MRYLPLKNQDRSAMLATIGAASIDDLFIDIPEEARLTGPITACPVEPFAHFVSPLCLCPSYTRLHRSGSTASCHVLQARPPHCPPRNTLLLIRRAAEIHAKQSQPQPSVAPTTPTGPAISRP